MVKKSKMGRPRKLEGTQTYPFRLNRELLAQLKVYAAGRGISLNDYLREIVNDAWKAVPSKTRKECASIARQALKASEMRKGKRKKPAGQ